MTLTFLRSDLRRRAVGLAALTLLAFGVYLRALSPAFHPDDSPETITACATLSFQHPPGYPLHSLLGRLAVVLGPGPATFNVNAFSAAAAALALALAALILLELGRDFAPWARDALRLEAAAAAGALAIGATQTLFFQATIAKGGIYSLNLALSFAELLCLLKARDALLGAAAGGALPPKALRWTALASLLFGLGMAAHWTSQGVLLPGFALLLGEPLFRRRFAPPSWRRVLPILLAPLAGLALYLMLPLRARLGAPLIWSEAGGLKDLAWVFLRSQYAGAEASKSLAVFGRLLLRIGQDAVQDWTWPGILVLGGGWALLLRKRPWLGGALAALPGVLALAVAWKANPPADSFFIIDPYLVPFHAGLGLGLAGYAAVPQLRGRLGLGLLAGALALLAWQWKACEHHADYLGWDYANNLLLSAPKDSLLFCEGDSNTAGPYVARFVQGRRPDLTLVANVLVSYPWYQRLLARQDPRLKVPPQPLGTPPADLAWLARENAPRPVLWTNSYTKGWNDEGALLHRGLLLRQQSLRKPFTREALLAERMWPAYALRGVFAPGARRMDPISVRLVRDNYVEAVARLAQAFLDLKAYGDAAGLYRRLGVLRPGWAPPWLQAGNARWFAGDVAGAGEDWKRAAQEEPGSAEAWANLGLVAFNQGRNDDAAMLARKALGLNPGLANAKELLNKALTAAVSRTAPAAAAIPPGQAAALRGDALAGRKKPAGALQAYEEALRLGYVNAAVLRNRAVMLGQLNRLAEAADAMAKAVAAEPGNAELRKLHGYFLYNSGHQAEGVAELEAALKLAPQDAEIRRLRDQAAGKKP